MVEIDAGPERLSRKAIMTGIKHRVIVSTLPPSRQGSKSTACLVLSPCPFGRRRGSKSMPGVQIGAWEAAGLALGEFLSPDSGVMDIIR